MKGGSAADVSRKLQAISKDLPKTVAFGMYAFGLEIIRRAGRTVPVDTGRLRASAFAVPPKMEGNVWRVVIGYGVEYAMFVHEGTSRMQGRAWLQQAINSFSPAEALAIVEKVVDAAAAGYFKGTPAVSTFGISKGPKRGD